ncbi:MAG: RNA polymerase sigma factor, partial [Nocardioides sp.]
WEAWEVRTAVDRLPDGEREVMRLRYAGGFTQSQIADRLGVPIGTVKSRTTRAHDRLQESLAHLSSASAGETSTDLGSETQ